VCDKKTRRGGQDGEGSPGITHSITTLARCWRDCSTTPAGPQKAGPQQAGPQNATARSRRIADPGRQAGRPRPSRRSPGTRSASRAFAALNSSSPAGRERAGHVRGRSGFGFYPARVANDLHLLHITCGSGCTASWAGRTGRTAVSATSRTTRSHSTTPTAWRAAVPPTGARPRTDQERHLEATGSEASPDRLTLAQAVDRPARRR
jgi:hypothetical protein